MKKITVLAASLAFSTMAFAQFEGSIEFKMETKKDTTNNIYYVKGNDVKLDQIGRKSGKVEGSFVFDLKGKTIKFVNPARKVWGNKTETPATPKGTFQVVKGKDSKVICGKKCVDYVVKNAEENTQITYWINTEGYGFFAPLVQMWNRKDKQSVYFNQIKELPKGAMPMMSVETDLNNGPAISKLEVVKVDKKAIDPSLVSVPADYKKFEQN
ncbi:MAG: DUF4412 domain-containing protein [Bacteroidetes bacterium]|nr:DUF4412 domain-containing protein [Bacteroidota bacterium]